MKNKKLLQIFILAAVVVIAVITVGQSLINGEKGPPKVGDKPIDFTLQDLDGVSYHLSDYKGQPIVLNFWGTFCPPCVDEMPAIDKQYQKWKVQGVVILGINLGESKVRIESFLREVPVTFPIIQDPKMGITREYGVRSYPTTFFINKEGMIVDIVQQGMSEKDIEHRLEQLMG